MIRKTFGKLRQKPKTVRDTIAFWMAGGFVCVVALVWIYNAPARFSDLKLVDSENVIPVKSFFEQMTDQVATVQESFTEVADAVVGTSSQTTGSATDGNETLGTMIESFRQNSQVQSTTTNSIAASSTATSAASSADVVAPREVRIITTSSSTVENTAQ